MAWHRTGDKPIWPNADPIHWPVQICRTRGWWVDCQKYNLTKIILQFYNGWCRKKCQVHHNLQHSKYIHACLETLLFFSYFFLQRFSITERTYISLTFYLKTTSNFFISIMFDKYSASKSKFHEAVKIRYCFSQVSLERYVMLTGECFQNVINFLATYTAWLFHQSLTLNIQR